MKTTPSMKLYLAIVVLALVIVSDGWAAEPKAERYIAAQLGWTYTTARSDTGSFGSGTSQITVKVTERMWEGKRVIAFVSPMGVLLENPDGSWIAFLGPDDKPVISWDPPLTFEWPLEVGKKWTRSYRLTVHAANQTIAVDSAWKVEAYEDVTVPAGTFKVFKVSSSDNVGNEGVTWFSPELGIFVKQVSKRTDKNPSGPGTREQELIAK